MGVEGEKTLEQQMNILVVGRPDVAWGLNTALTSIGNLGVTTAHNYEEIPEALKNSETGERKRIDAIVCVGDVPWEEIKRLVSGEKDIPFVVITSRPETEASVSGRNLQWLRIDEKLTGERIVSELRRQENNIKQDETA